jgi:hypothetical protein
MAKHRSVPLGEPLEEPPEEEGDDQEAGGGVTTAPVPEEALEDADELDEDEEES